MALDLLHHTHPGWLFFCSQPDSWCAQWVGKHVFHLLSYLCLFHDHFKNEINKLFCFPLVSLQKSVRKQSHVESFKS